MSASRLTMRRASQLRTTAQRHGIVAHRPVARFASSSPQQPPRGAPKGNPKDQPKGSNVVGFVTVFAGAGAAAYLYPTIAKQFENKPEDDEPKAKPKAELKFEQPRQQPTSKEDNRDLISSQHLQVKKSWEHPGVYAWGSNTGKVIDPNSNDKNIKLPRRLEFFNDQLLRDLKLTQEFGAAVTEKGDLVQWGLGFSKTNPAPVTTLRGKDLVKLDVSEDRIIALAKNGSVFSIPSSRDDQQGGIKPEGKGSSWSLWSSGNSEAINFRSLTPKNLAWGEKVTDVSSGQEHCLMLTSKGRVFAAVSSATAFPSKGQMGIPGLSWENRPAGPYDQAHEVKALHGFEIAQIATGDFHSAVLDKLGRLFTFGDNTYGQLGFDSASSGVSTAYAPTLISIDKQYAKSGLVPKVTSLAAGGLNTFFTVDAEQPKNVIAAGVAPSQRMPKTTSDLWALGQGTYGTLGTGKWTHVTSGPNKVKSLSSLFEFDEKTNKMMPIKLKSLSIGTSHCSVIMDNVTETSAGGWGSKNDTNYGADVLFWGGNEHYQLGTGKRSNLNTPSYIGPLDGGEGDAEKGRQEVHRMCLTPRQTARIGEGGKGRKVTLEQKVSCGRFVTGVYSSV